ncbi:hypothetical protein JL720_14790 [Aureococcus anophagefferens]|nr:hypothetical protein JL720_14790 [Aureococcus anophagefferens]
MSSTSRSRMTTAHKPRRPPPRQAARAPAAAPRPAPTPAAAPRPVKTPAAPPPAEVTPDAPAPPRRRRAGAARDARGDDDPELKRAEKRRRLGTQASQESEEDQLARILAESEETERAEKRRRLEAQASQESEEDQLARILAESAATAEAEARERAEALRRADDERKPLTTAEFVALWRATEEGTGVAMTDIEAGTLVRTGNAAGSVSGATQDKAQYGRLFFGATRTVAELTNLKASEVFVDIGCGVGNATMQMACTVGCEARGIELMPDRHIVGHEHMWPALQHAIGERDGPPPKVGEVVLRQADLADPAVAEFLSSADVAFVNNYNEIFGARSCKHGGGPRRARRVFACMKPGSRMVTFHRSRWAWTPRRFFRPMLTIKLMSAGSGCEMDPSENDAPMKASREETKEDGCGCLLGGNAPTKAMETAPSDASAALALVRRAALVANLSNLAFGYDVGVMSGALLYLRRPDQLGFTDVQAEVAASLFNLAAGGVARRRGAAQRPPRPPRRAAGFRGAPPRRISASPLGTLMAELAPTKERGKLTAVADLGINVGIVVGYASSLACIGVFRDDERRWRSMLGLGASLPAALLLLRGALPESPRWLLANGRADEARRVLEAYHVPADAADTADAFVARVAGRRPAAAAARASETERRRSLQGFAVQVLAASLGVGVVKLLGVVVAMARVERAGRRPMLALSGASLAVTLALLAATVAAGAPSELRMDVADCGPKGLGAFAAEACVSGSYVCDYVGESIDFVERATRYQRDPPAYLFHLGGGAIAGATDPTVVIADRKIADAARRGVFDDLKGKLKTAPHRSHLDAAQRAGADMAASRGAGRRAGPWS